MSIQDGNFDVTPEETKRIVDGLRNMADNTSVTYPGRELMYEAATYMERLQQGYPPAI